MSNAGITVSELAAATALGRATLRAGRAGLDREVRRVQWMEVLDDFADYLAPGDLLLTTAYNLGDQPELQRALAGRMADAGVSAMVVKCGYYLEDVPYPVRRQADELGLPVFELPRQVPFVELSQSIYELLVSRSYARLRRSADVHRELVRLLAEGAPLAGIVRRAAALLGNPVLVEDARGGRLAGFRPSGAALGDAPADGALAAPVVARGAVHGRVLLLPERPIADDDPQALEQVATVVALEIARSEQELRAERERLADLVRDLLAGRAGDDEEAARRAVVLGVHLPDRLAAAVFADGAAPAGLPLVAAEGGATVAVLHAGDAPAVPGGFAEAAGGVAGLPNALARARRAWRIGLALTGERRLHRYEEVRTYDLLVGHLEGEQLAELRASTLDRLPAVLRETLEAYLRSGGSVSTTAAETYVHRNTVRYRLRRIREVTGIDVARPEQRLLCELVLLAERVAG